MENNNNNISVEEMEFKLWEFIDGAASANDRSFVEQMIAKNAEWQVKYQELLTISSLLKDAELESPSLRFTKNVMEEIARVHIASSTRRYINKRIIWSIAAVFIIMLVGSIVFAFGQTDWNATPSTELPVKIPTYDFSKLFSSTYVNVFMMINIMLGLFLLDRVLARKREAYRNGI